MSSFVSVLKGYTSFFLQIQNDVHMNQKQREEFQPWQKISGYHRKWIKASALSAGDCGSNHLQVIAVTSKLVL